MREKTIKDIPLSVIEDAVKGETYALQFVLLHFRNYIKALSTKTFTDTQGKQRYILDEDVKSRLEAKLVLGITKDFVINY